MKHTKMINEWNEMFGLCFDRCTKCKRRLKLRQKITSQIDYLTCEYVESCVHCGSPENYYAYGSTDRPQRRDYYYYAATFPRWFKVFQFLRQIRLPKSPY